MGAKSYLPLVLALLLTAIIAVAPSRTLAFPEPSLVVSTWEFKFSYEHPRAISVQNLAGEWEWYWYMTYKVVNNTGQERLFIPEIAIATEQGDILVAGRGVRTNVFDEIKKKVGNRLLESPSNVVGQILQGEDHAKESVAIWPATKHNVDLVTVFFGGLSGETAVVKVPDTADPSKTIDALVSKTLMIDYEYPGAPQSPQNQAVVPKGDKWIMR